MDGEAVEEAEEGGRQGEGGGQRREHGHGEGHTREHTDLEADADPDTDATESLPSSSLPPFLVLSPLLLLPLSPLPH